MYVCTVINTLVGVTELTVEVTSLYYLSTRQPPQDSRKEIDSIVHDSV